MLQNDIGTSYLAYYVLSAKMAGYLGLFRRPVQNGLIQVQRVKISRSRLSTLYLCTSGAVVVFVLFCPFPNSILPAEAQEMLQRRKGGQASQYGEAWQKEHQRLNQLTQQADNADSSLEAMRKSDRPHPQPGAVFFPITWLSKREPEYYSASGPEWQAFVELSNDAERAKAVRSKLSNTVCEMASNSNAITGVIGKPLMVHASWLDFDFPSRAPAQYECSGILWADNKITWATRRLDDAQVNRLHRVLFPVTLFSSLQAMITSLLKSHYASWKSLWSMSVNSEKSEHQMNTTTVLSVQKRPSTSQQSTSPAPSPNIQTDSMRHFMDRQERNSAIFSAVKAFKFTFSKHWRMSQVHQIRGACLLTGEVGIKGPRGRWKFSVFAQYLPEEDTFVQIDAISKGFWRNSQAPNVISQEKNPPKS